MHPPSRANRASADPAGPHATPGERGRHPLRGDRADLGEPRDRSPRRMRGATAPRASRRGRRRLPSIGPREPLLPERERARQARPPGDSCRFQARRRSERRCPGRKGLLPGPPLGHGALRPFRRTRRRPSAATWFQAPRAVPPLRPPDRGTGQAPRAKRPDRVAMRGDPAGTCPAPSLAPRSVPGGPHGRPRERRLGGPLGTAPASAAREDAHEGAPGRRDARAPRSPRRGIRARGRPRYEPRGRRDASPPGVRSRAARTMHG